MSLDKPSIRVTVIDKDNIPSDEVLKQILKLNIKMLESIGSTVLATSRAAYGLREDGSWDDEQFNKYKIGNVDRDVEYLHPTTGEPIKQASFQKKLAAQGHTIFTAYNDSGDLIALASGDLNNIDAKLPGKDDPRWEARIKAAEDLGGSYFRLLNVSVDEGFRHKKIGTELLKMANNHLVSKGVTIIEGPVSREAQKDGVDIFYKYVLDSFAIERTTEMDRANQLVYTVTNPKTIEIGRDAESKEEFSRRSSLDDLLARGAATSYTTSVGLPGARGGSGAHGR